jgi:RsiW-degrading membrane proteinase PrsW (M82 family)
MNSHRLFLLPLLSFPYWLWNDAVGGSHLPAGNLLPLLYVALAFSAFVAAGWWLFGVDCPEQRRDWIFRCLWGCFGGMGILYLVMLLMDSPLVAGSLFGLPITLLLKSAGMADAVKDANAFPLWASVVGYTIGVGMSEEFSKAAAANPDTLGMLRERAAQGFASGVGFGLAEAVLYSLRDYADESPWQMYFIRFTFCVGFHGAMSAIGVLCLPDDWKDRTEWIKTALCLLPIAWLHGLYDALLVHEYRCWAGVVACLVLVGLPAFMWWKEEIAGDA